MNLSNLEVLWHGTYKQQLRRLGEKNRRLR